MAHQDKHGDGEYSGDRIAKVIARAGLASRREAEEWIAAGRVAVNGTVIRSPACNVTAHDRVNVDGEPLPARQRTRLFLYHKPRGLMTSHADPQGRPTIFQRLPKHLPRLVSVGRLDFNTEGLILLTNDGALARLLELPATGWLRRYRVRAHGSVSQARLDELRAGVTVEGINYAAIEATLDRVQGSNLWLTFAIREGKHREVRAVLGHIGLAVTRLIRISFGPFQLGELAEGAVEEVRTRVLREQLGERLVALSGADFSGPITERADPPPRHLHRHPEPAAKWSSKDERPKHQPKSRSPISKHLSIQVGDSQPEGRRPSRLRPIKSGIAAQGEGERKSRAYRSRTPPPAHSWRGHEQERPAKKLKRKFRGSRRDDGTPRDRPAKKPRAGLLKDRKGRRVLVERFAPAPSAASPSPQPGPRKPPPPPSGARHRRPRPRDR